MPKNKALNPRNKFFRFVGKMILFVVLIIFLLALLIDISSALIFSSSSNLYLNWSSSMPIGLYKLSAPNNLQRGDSVVVCLPKAVGLEGLKRGYLSLESGKCPNGYNVIVKELIAVTGDDVTLTSQNIIVNGQVYFAPTQTYDNAHLPISAIPRGNYKHTASYWLYGANDPAYSWDSRYWGGVREDNIIKLAHPVPYLTSKSLR